ncbi:UNVERIFIED_ORG: hypothetical protein EDC92_1485 [Dietzia maris]|uniref:helix-turn-helix transcriptional regulator n=1 Tax=Dietzia maris TaxID=37915 RepID=UPI0010465046
MTARIGTTISHLRVERSVQWLADETKGLGHHVSRTTLWELEAGKRKNISVAELLIIAAALEVPPLSLVFPELPDGVVRALPDTPMTSFDAIRWASGEGDLPTRPWELVPLSLDPDDFLDEDELPDELPATQLYKYDSDPDRFLRHPNTELLALCRQYAALNQRTSNRMMELMPGTPTSPDDWKEELDRLVEDHNAHARVLEQSIVRAGGKIGVGDGLGGDGPAS